MNEAEARAWISANTDVPRETLLAKYVDLLIAASTNQNLISPSSIAEIWSRHIVDSAQLVPLAADVPGVWMDIGSGAGLPGIVAAILRDDPVVLVEPRRKRVEFLDHCVATLGLRNVKIEMAKMSAINSIASVISARAVASINQLFEGARQCANPDTLWLLPRGMSGREELAVARKSWQGSFHVEQSVTNPESAIVIARGVRPR